MKKRKETTLRDIEKFIKKLDEDKKDVPIRVEAQRDFADPEFHNFLFTVPFTSNSILIKLKVKYL